MISDRTLDLAVAAGIIDAEQRTRLQALEAAMPDETVPAIRADDEALRLVSGFSDIFVTIGILLFLGATAFLVGKAGPAAAALAVAGASWLLAEIFTRRRRQALPSIVLLVAFAVAVWFGVMSLLGVGGEWEISLGEGAGVMQASLVTLLATALHYWRFRVPITVAAAASAAVLIVVSAVLRHAPDGSSTPLAIAVFLSGLAVFGLAMRIDATDLARVTRRTDVAFWLHMLAAPLIVHSVLSLVVLDRTEPTTGAALVVLVLFALLALVAVVIDRRALMVSGLAYAGYAFGSLISDWGNSSVTVPVTLLVLGSLILSLSTAWQMLRAQILRRLPSRLVDILPAAQLRP